jgi:peptidylprolyl isomerase
VAGKDRKRQIARERYQKRMAAKAQARAKARQRTAMGLSAGAVVAIVGIVLAITLPGSGKKAASGVSGTSPSPSASSTSASPTPPAPTTAAGCTTKPSVVASPIANFPLLPAGVDSALKTEPKVTVPAGAVPTKTTVKDLVEGTGATVGKTDSVTVNYLGVNYVDCGEFDSSWSRNTVATFSLQGVIPGFSKGIGGDSASGIAPMKVGGRREIIVPPTDGYGVAGSSPNVAPNEELVFVVDVLAASTPSPSPSASSSSSASPSASATQ